MTLFSPSTVPPSNQDGQRSGIGYTLAGMSSRWFALLGLALAFSVVSGTAADDYPLTSESVERRPGVPRGRVESFAFNDSKVFPNTSRAGWVYIPAQYDASHPPALMVFQDGHTYVREDGRMRVPIVFDNLIAAGEMPVTVGVFINPGHRGTNGPPDAGWGHRNNRSLEYDGLGDAYARFLLEELLPFVAQRFDLRWSDDPARRAIAGMSSGGICAWTVAWERPDQFGRVLSHIGSFVNIRGGHVYPALIRKTERKPIRVFLQDGSNDLNNLHGHWPLANLEMASALAFAGYDFRFVYGDGAHNDRHGSAILPDSLRWLWRDGPGTLPTPENRDNLAGDEALVKLLPGGGREAPWQSVAEGLAFTDAAAVDAKGAFYFSDLPRGNVHRIADPAAPQPVLEAWLEKGPKISGMTFAADGQLYAASQGDFEGPNQDLRRVVSIDPVTKSVTTVALELQPNDLVVTRSGWMFVTETGTGQVLRIPTSARDLRRPPPVAGGIDKPNGIALSPDERFLWVSEYGGRHVWQFVITEDGSLRGGQRMSLLQVPAGRPDSGGDGATTDAAGRVWVTSHAGVQVFDAVGRLSAVLERPQDKATVSTVLAGAQRNYLYVCSSDRIYRRPVLVPSSPR